MNSNEHHLSTQVALLDEYAKCLEKENQAKSRQIQTLHQHLGLIGEENEVLRTALSELRSRLKNRQAINSAVCSLTTSLNLEEMPKKEGKSQAWCQTHEDNTECQGQITQVLELSDAIRLRDLQILKYQQEGEEMVEAIEELQDRLKQLDGERQNDRKMIAQLEQSISTEKKRNKSVQLRVDELMRNMALSGQDSELYQSRCDKYEGRLQELVSENNTLIERVLALEKQKNDYYHQIKRMSRVSFGSQNLAQSNKKDTGSKKERFRQIEESLRQLQMQNEAIHSNLRVQR